MAELQLPVWRQRVVGLDGDAPIGPCRDLHCKAPQCRDSLGRGEQQGPRATAWVCDPTTALSVVIPAFNEESRIGDTLDTLLTFLEAHLSDWEIRVVDDGSRDRTAPLVEDFCRQNDRVVLQREPHRGKGGAVRAGLLAARKPLRFICDADLAMPVTELPRFLSSQAQEADVIIGTREGHGARRIGEPIVRHLAGRAFNYAVQRLMVKGIEDTQCGFKMFSARAVESIFPLVRVEGWAFDVEVLHIARLQQLRILEVPIEWHYGSQSQVSLLRDGVTMARDLWGIRARASRGEYAASNSTTTALIEALNA